MLEGIGSRNRRRRRKVAVAVAASLLASICDLDCAVAVADDGPSRLALPIVTIYPGDVIKRELLVEREVPPRKHAYKSYHASIETIVGKVAIRVLQAGKAIPLNAVREPFVFKEGQRVTLVFSEGGLEITATGQATQPGAVGQTINVKNLDSGVVVRGVVQADGNVAVGDPRP